MPGVDDLPPDVAARGYGAAGGVCYWQADVAATHHYYDLALAAARRAGDDQLLARALYNYAFAASDELGQTTEMYVAGLPYFEESLAIHRRIGDARGVADANWGLASSLAARGDSEAAIRHVEAALEEYERIEDPFGIGWAEYMLAGLKARAGRYETGIGNLRRSLEIFAAAGDRVGILLNLAGFAMTASARGDQEQAVRIGGAVETLRAATGAALLDDAPEWFEFSIPKRPVDDPQALEWWDEGASMTTEEAVTYVQAKLQASAG
jgi:tetratricopeptide (TPR) repeat protein